MGKKGFIDQFLKFKNHCSLLYMEMQPLPPSLPDVGDVGALRTFSNKPAAADGIARSSQLSSPMPRHALDVMAGGAARPVQIVTSPPLSSSQAGQETVLGRFSTAFGLWGGYHLVETENELQPAVWFFDFR
jgi:hypothetical protein